jgi:membrane protein implicated in regulation of membrane protease activity
MTPSDLSAVVLGSFAVLVTASAFVLDRVARTRNSRGQCAKCAQSVSIAGGSRIEGKVYCPRCAARLKARITAAYLGLAALLAVFGVGAVIGSLSLLRRGDPSWWLFGVVMAGSVAFLALLMRLVRGGMRDRNRLAEKVEQARAHAAAWFGEHDASGPSA